MSKDDLPAGVDELKVIQETPIDTTATEKEQQQAVTDLSKRAKGESMKVKVYSPFNDYYDGLAFSLTAESETGPFDILPKHHNFISLLKACDLVVRTVTQGDRRIRISGGLIHVKANQVIIFLDI